MRVVRTPNPTYPHYHQAARVTFTGKGMVEVFQHMDKHFGKIRPLLEYIAIEFQKSKDFMQNYHTGDVTITVAYVYYRYYGRLRLRARVLFDVEWKDESPLGIRPYLFMVELGSADTLEDPRPAIVRFLFDIKEERFTPHIPYWNAPK